MIVPGHKGKTKKQNMNVPTQPYVEIVFYKRSSGIFNVRGKQFRYKQNEENISTIRLSEDDIYDHAPVGNKLYYLYHEDDERFVRPLRNIFFTTKALKSKYVKEHMKSLVAEFGERFGTMEVVFSHKDPHATAPH